MKKTRKIAKSAASIAPIADAEAAVRETGPAEKIPPMIRLAGHAETNLPEAGIAGRPGADPKTSGAVTGDSSETLPENYVIWKIRATSMTRANAPGQTQDPLSGSTAVTAAAGE
jgi:hypothetical protein